MKYSRKQQRIWSESIVSLKLVVAKQMWARNFFQLFIIIKDCFMRIISSERVTNNVASGTQMVY